MKSDTIQASLAGLLPRHLLSRLMYKATRWSWRPWKNTLIRLFIWKYHVDMNQAEKPSADDYGTFNGFFTRALKPGQRPITRTDGVLVSPVDGTVSATGAIKGMRLFQAKGRDYSLAELVKGESRHIEYYRNGSFITLYLSPRDYHRVHMPADGELHYMAYVPGQLFSVNPASVQRIDGLFARNERVITTFRTDIGMLSVIFVGAVFVGSMEMAWHGQVTPADRREYSSRYYAPGMAFARGEELGRFNMGSTVVLLVEPDKVNWNVPGNHVVMGQVIGTRKQGTVQSVALLKPGKAFLEVP